jgi:hypothetical protein
MIRNEEAGLFDQATDSGSLSLYKAVPGYAWRLISQASWGSGTDTVYLYNAYFREQRRNWRGETGFAIGCSGSKYGSLYSLPDSRPTMIALFLNLVHQAKS